MRDRKIASLIFLSYIFLFGAKFHNPEAETK